MVNKRKILITGGTGKIGAVLVEQMLNDGHQVIFTSTSNEKAAALKKRLNGYQEKLDFSILKFERENEFEAWVERLPFKIDAVIHNARSLKTLQIESSGFSAVENIAEEFKIAVTYPYLITQRLIEQGHPLRDIIFISSIYGVVAPNRNLYEDFHRQSPIQYGIAKAAQLHTMKELAVRLADKSIRVNAISYGGVQGRADQGFVQRYNNLSPTGRMLGDSDLYPPVQFMLNNFDLNITGENLMIDGGWTIW